MSKILNVLIIFSFLFSSCSNTNTTFSQIQREIASTDENLQSGPSIIFRKSSSSEAPVSSLESFVSDLNTNYQNRTFNGNETRAIEVVIVDRELANDVAFSVDAQIKSNGTHQIVIARNSQLEIDKLSSDYLKNFINLINNEKIYPNSYSFFEVMYNAKNDHLESRLALEKMKLMALESELSDAAGELKDGVAADISSFQDKISKNKKEIKAREAARKEIMSVLDKVSDDGQLKTMLQKNDREGVASLLEKYLPREHMTPMEHSFWDHVIHTIRKPADLKDRVLVYRGTLGDRLYPAIENGKELPYEQAVKEGKLAAMSTILTRNQGTWNRRLRSLQTIYDKKLTQNPFNSGSEFTQTARLTTWMKQHSIEAQGSPFLSYTSSFDIGYRFGFSIGKSDAADEKGAKSMGAFLVDPDLLLFNQMTGFKSEMEYLLSLVSFPDEMAGFFDESINGVMTRDDIKVHFDDHLKKIISQKYGDEHASEIVEKILKVSADFNDSAVAYLHPQVKTVKVESKIPVEPSMFKKMWGKLVGKDMTSFKTEYSYSKSIEDMPKMNNCLYIIKSFYK